MRFISSLCWVPKGKSSTPTQLKIEQNDMKKIFEESDKNDEEDDEEILSSSEVNENDNDDDDAKINKKYNLDDYDDEGL